ncbi:hypothetical protein DFS34DRAFT_642997 [Phlyctochytrium arcticum]|nr:hypothetical protein DFS34DRAFT_642997 [Phlyctochytrium arcticum]
MSNAGVTPIKAEYLLSQRAPEAASDRVKTELPTSLKHGASDEVENGSKRRRGQNQAKDRKSVGRAVKDNLCNAVSKGESCDKGDSCKWSHDVEAYLNSKPADLGPKCPQIEAFGECKYGLKCYFARGHRGSEEEQVSHLALQESERSNPSIQNTLPRDFQKDLRTRRVKLHKSEDYVAWYNVAKLERAKRNVSMPDSSGLDKFEYDPDTIRLKNDSKKTIDFRGKTYLAPLTTVGNLPFRRICKSFGVDITCGEMAMATNLLSGQQHEWALTKRHKSETLFGVQIAGNSVPSVVRCCESLVQANISVDFVDLNLGCPVDGVTKIGAGSALLEQKGKLYDMCAGANLVLGEIPFTVKLRQGISSSKPVAHKLLPLFAEAGVSAVTLHGRSKEQRYTKRADWKYIADCAQAAQPFLFFGNGDIFSQQDYWDAMDQKMANGIMIGRGALIKPWIFTEIAERRTWDISSRERLDILKDFGTYGMEYWGTDSVGINNTRRFLCEWLSFLHRYVPVGLLEVLPQRMNDRPPPFFGRDELETLMASNRSRDWIKLTELVLGPAPESFDFLPK